MKYLYLIITIIALNSCTSIKQYGVYNQTYPEWMLDYKIYRNYLGFQYEDTKKEDFTWDKNNFFIENSRTFGSNNIDLRLLINPSINFKKLKIIEVSYIDNQEKIYLVKNKKIKNKGYRYKQLVKLNFFMYSRYFKNMNIGDEKNVTISQIYQFDDGPIIEEKARYILSCYEDEFVFLYIPVPTR